MKIIIMFFLLLQIGCSNTKPISKLQKRISTLRIRDVDSVKLKTVASKRIGIIIDKGYDKEKSQNILNGLKQSALKIKLKFKGRFFIVKSTKDASSIKKNINKLKNINKVSVVLSWGDKDYLDEISKQLQSYKLPTFFISKDRFSNKNIYTISPNSMNYGQVLSKALVRRNIKRIAILTPDRYKNSLFLNTVKKQFEKEKITIVYDVPYISNNYYSMSKACEEIFVIDNYKRRVELSKIFTHEKMKAKSQGFSLNKELVFLPAQINFDAIFIPDDFRMARHFVKLFEFYKAKGIQLIGTHEWRSESLLANSEPLLEGAIFVDFIGDYNSTPLAEGTAVKPKYFISSKDSIGLDYSLMGFYAGLLSQIAGNIPTRAKSINNILKNLNLNDQFLGKRKAFTRNSFNWPTFLFQIKSNHLRIIKK